MKKDFLEDSNRSSRDCSIRRVPAYLSANESFSCSHYFGLAETKIQ